jgi:hypothetical protein
MLAVVCLRRNFCSTKPFDPYTLILMSHESAGDDKTRLISLAEAAELYGFSHVYLSELAKRGRLKAQKIGNSWVTTPNDVEEFIGSRQKRGVFRDDIPLD